MDMCLSALLIAWILSWFTFDQLFITAFQELFKLHITTASYYFIFFIGGLVMDILSLLYKLK